MNALRKLFFMILPVLFSYTVDAQKILVLENCKNLKNFKYYRGDEIRLKIHNKEAIVQGMLYDMTDSTIDVIPTGIIPIDSLEHVYREIAILRIFSSFFLYGGTAYFVLDSFNRLINDDSPVFLAETAIISGSLIGAGLIMRAFKYREIDLEKKWAFKMLDFSNPK